MSTLSFAGDQRLTTAACPGARWLVHLQLWRPLDPDHLVTGDCETAAILLGGTFDLVGGATAWPARGARQDPFTGRPMAVFLPKHTEFRTSKGRGEILLIAARQPARREPPSGRDAFASKPLLPLAGSGKSFDPNSGEWKPAETFPEAPESLPPRRFERIQIGACALERIFASDYKAATLSVDEVVVPAGASFALADVPRRPACDEVALFVRRSTASGATSDTTMVLPGLANWTLPASDATTYVVLAWAGKSGSGG